MKPQRQLLEVFSLSFLDIISCAFGAIVMLVLLAKNGDSGDFKDVGKLATLIQSVSQMESQVQQLDSVQQNISEELKQLKSQRQSALKLSHSLESTVARAKEKTQKLNSSAEGLKILKESQLRAATQSDTSKKRDEEVGGIPVDSEYVIFIVDTSGSMQRIWSRLLSEMNRILDIHPKVKGFQVMNDMGSYLLKNYKGKWIKDGKKVRKRVINLMKSWFIHSNSSPVEGLEVALKTYAKPSVSLSIYILGDEYNGGSYDPVIKTLNRLNTNKITGKRMARVHAVGFWSGQDISRYSTLMREVARQNRGTFIALPR